MSANGEWFAICPSIRGVHIRRLVVIAVVAATLSLVLGTWRVAFAHNWDWCGDGHAIGWSGTSTTHWWPSEWDSSYRTAISSAQTAFNVSDFDFGASTLTSALNTWQDLNNTVQTDIAGAASIAVNCSTHEILGGTLYFNFPHFTAAVHTTAQKQCTAIHEMGHVAGFDHNDLQSILQINGWTQCHENLWNTLQTHDTSDINGRY